jgi:propionyl-CoA carboxylase beta chain
VAERARRERKPRGLSPVRRTRPKAAGATEAPELRPATAAEQKLDRFRKRRYEVLHQETEPARRRRAEGKPGARERIEALLDAGSFVELDMFATARATGFGMEEKRQPRGGGLFL